MNKYKEALERIKDNFCVTCDEQYKKEGKCDCPFQDDADLLLEAVEKAEKYDEKEKPKKPIKTIELDIVSGYYTSHSCPNCNNELLIELPSNIISNKKYKYCPECGQAIDWSGNNE